MKLQINDRLVIPEQDLDGKLAYVAIITDVYPCNPSSGLKDDSISFEDAKAVRIDIQNRTGFGGASGPTLRYGEFRRFMEAYEVPRPENLVGKPVISVYNNSMISGLIPLNLD